MFWFVVIAVVGFVGFKFFFSLQKDNDDLQNRTLADKFQTIVSMVNEATFNGQGEVTSLDKREFNLYKEDSNQIIKFQYSTGILTITWKYKYFQKEVVHQRVFDNARNLSIFEQQKIAQAVVAEMSNIIAKHKAEVLGPEAIAPLSSLPISKPKPLDANTIQILRTGLEKSLREMLHEALENSHDMPEMMHGLMVMQAAGKFKETFNENYHLIKKEAESDGRTYFLSRTEYETLIKSVISKVLNEFIENPEDKPSIHDTYLISKYNVSIKNREVGNITVGLSCANDVFNEFGQNYTLRQLGPFANQIVYANSGISFYYKPTDEAKTIFIIEVIFPFTGLIENSLKINESTLQDIINIYGHPTEMHQMDSYINFKANSSFFGFDKGAAFITPGVPFEYERMLDHKLERVKMF